MSPSTKASEVVDPDFKWGKKKGIGGKQKECQFYESFTYKNDNYSLYDSVFLHKEGEPEPYIGKLVKIWEQEQRKKKVKVLWFFRPVEITNFLEEGSSLENELLLASGDGKGLADINNLVTNLAFHRIYFLLSNISVFFCWLLVYLYFSVCLKFTDICAFGSC